MVRLGDVCEKKIATLPAGFSKEIIYVDISSVDNTSKEITSYQEISGKDAPSRARQILNSNDVIVSTVRPNLNAVAMNTIDSSNTVVASTGYCVLRCKKGVDAKYVFKFCQTEKFISSLVKVAKGASYPAVSNTDVKYVEIPLPPLDEQKRIAKNLDLASEIVKGYKEQLAELDKLVQSVFYEMFGDPVTNEKGWEKHKWKVVFNTTTGKLDSNAMVESGEYPFFTCAKEQLWIDKYDFDCEALLLAGNNAAGVYDVKYYKGKFNAYQRTYVLTLKNDTHSYRLFKLQLENKLQLLKHQSKGTNTRYLTMGILNELDFIIPPLPLQTRFAAIVTEIEAQKAQVQRALTEAENLFNSLMQEYFE